MYQIRMYLVSAGRNLYVMFQIRNTYVPGIGRQKSIRTYVMFRPWTHTSDDSYIYQLSLVVTTATVSCMTIIQNDYFILGPITSM